MSSDLGLATQEATSVAVEVVAEDSSFSWGEEQDLERHEATIRAAMRSYFEVGMALQAIYEKRLYRRSHPSFEEYCAATFGMSRAHAYRVMEASQVAQNLLPTGDIPVNEAQARELAKLPQDAQLVVWSRVKEGDEPITAKHIQSVAQEVAPEHVPSPRPRLPAMKPSDPSIPEGEIISGTLETAHELTPHSVITLVLEVCGQIDLDPCSDNLDNPNVPAKACYAPPLDGLDRSHIWAGVVFVYPPDEDIVRLNHWAYRLRKEFEEGHCLDGFFYVPLRYINRWLNCLKDYPFAVVPDQPEPMALVYIGDSEGDFEDACEKRCWLILRRVG